MIKPSALAICVSVFREVYHLHFMSVAHTALFGALIGFNDANQARETLIRSNLFVEDFTIIPPTRFKDYKTYLLPRFGLLLKLIISNMICYQFLATLFSLLIFALSGSTLYDVRYNETTVTVPAAVDCGFNLSFDGLTIGQAASASSAAVGGGSVQPWAVNVIEFARHHRPPCSVMPFLIEQVSEEANVKDEFLKLVGCKNEHSIVTAARWSKFFRSMAVNMNVIDSKGEQTMSHNMAIDAVRQHTSCTAMQRHACTVNRPKRPSYMDTHEMMCVSNQISQFNYSRACRAIMITAGSARFWHNICPVDPTKAKSCCW